jgi:hypothetical protein
MKREIQSVLDRVERRIARLLRPFLGRELTRVTYACLLGEATTDQIVERDFYLGGEVRLDFRGMKDPLVLTWDENAGWEEHFSVQARTSTAFKPGSLELLDASAVPIWKPCIGQLLVEFGVAGFSTAPQIISLVFPGNEVLVGCGWQDRFGDGDDVLVRQGGASNLGPELVSLYWETAPVSGSPLR